MMDVEDSPLWQRGVGKEWKAGGGGGVWPQK